MTNDDNELHRQAQERLRQQNAAEKNQLTDAEKPHAPYSGKYAMFMVLALWILLMGFGTIWAKRWFDNREAAQDPISGYSSDGKIKVELASGSRGHYRVLGQVNGQSVPFLVDTGATSIALSETLARNLGLKFGYPVTVSTANGAATAYNTILGSVEIGELRLERVPAFISPGLDDGTALLGMSFLKHFELTQRDGRLTIQAQ